MQERAGGVAQEVKGLPRKHEALHSNLCITKKVYFAFEVLILNGNYI
jgi:hypothetical protein